MRLLLPLKSVFPLSIPSCSALPLFPSPLQPHHLLSTADINIYNVAIPILSVLFIPSCSLSLSHGCSVDECNSCCLVCAEQICWEIRFSVLIWKECLYKLRSGVTICSQTFCSFIFSSPINLCFFLPHYLSCSFPSSLFSILLTSLSGSTPFSPALIFLSSYF